LGKGRPAANFEHPSAKHENSKSQGDRQRSFEEVSLLWRLLEAGGGENLAALPLELNWPQTVLSRKNSGYRGRSKGEKSLEKRRFRAKRFPASAQLLQVSVGDQAPAERNRSTEYSTGT